MLVNRGTTPWLGKIGIAVESRYPLKAGEEAQIKTVAVDDFIDPWLIHECSMDMSSSPHSGSWLSTHVALSNKPDWHEA